MKLLPMPKVGIVLDDTQYKRLRLNGDDTMYIHIHVHSVYVVAPGRTNQGLFPQNAYIFNVHICLIVDPLLLVIW